MTNPFTEHRTVQSPIVKYVSEIGWSEVSKGDALINRRGENEFYFHNLLAEKLELINPGVITNQNVGEILRQFELLQSNITGNEKVLRWLKGAMTMFLPEEKRDINIKFIDYDNPENNSYHVTEEWTYTNGNYTNRADIIFLINGIPIIVVETKAVHVLDGVQKALDQINRYHDETPEMMAILQVYNVPNILDYYYSVTWNFDKKNLFNWKDEEKGNFEKKVKRFFDKKRVLETLHDYIAFYKRDDQLYKVILRQHQTRAVQKVLERIKDDRRRRGLIWHAQGSGKTLTMITASQKLMRRPEFEKPTIIMLVDRNELESQLFNNLESFGIELHKGMEIAESKEHLRDFIRNDYRGLIISTIHKFDKIPPNLNNRTNIFVLIDEAHRTTNADLGNYLFATVPNATFIGFTGTPINAIAYGKGTFKIFGKDDKQGYLDKYSIAESIEDGTTLPLHYTLAPNDIRVPKQILENEFLILKESEGISDITELNKILDKAVNLKNFLKSKDRIVKVVSFIVNHFKTNVEPMGYKAFAVGVDREECALLKEEFDRLLPEKYSKVVYTPAHNDQQRLKKFYLSEDEEKQIRKSFVKPQEFPKILIVTEKLLTGFDAPVLYCMYLDKPMRDHTLLQAIARVNRPFEDKKGIKKPAGFVLDFVGIFDKLEKALAFDSDVVGSVISNIDVLKVLFEDKMKTVALDYLKFAQGIVDDKTIEEIIEFFLDEKKRDDFYHFFKELEIMYEIISPDAFLRPYIDDYGKLSILYDIVYNAFSTRIIISKDLMKKTENLVREKVSSGGFRADLPIYEIDENTLEALRKDSSSDGAKVINLGRSLIRTLAEKEIQAPYLIPMRERAQAIKESYDDRQTSTTEALKDFEKIIEEYNRSKEEAKEKDFDMNTFSIYWVLKRNDVKDAENLAKSISPLFDKYSNFQKDKFELRELKKELYKILLKSLDNDIERVKNLTDKLMKLSRPS